MYSYQIMKKNGLCMQVCLYTYVIFIYSGCIFLIWSYKPLTFCGGRVSCYAGNGTGNTSRILCRYSFILIYDVDVPITYIHIWICNISCKARRDNMCKYIYIYISIYIYTIQHGALQGHPERRCGQKSGL